MLVRSLFGGVALAAVLSGCGSNSAPDLDVLAAKLKELDVGVTDVSKPERDPTSPLPNSYKDRIAFSITEVAPKGGQIFSCDKKEYCDALFVYFDALKFLAGPYLYRSKSGLVVAQLNSRLTPQTAEKVKAVIDGY